MPKVSIVAKNYAKALFNSAKKHSVLESVFKELESFRDNFNNSFANELKNPVISRQDIEKIMTEISQQFNFSKITTEFFVTLSKNHRLNLFPEIYQEFNRLIKNQSKIISAELISAEKMIDEQIEQIKSIISKKYPDKTIEIIEKINKNLIGGFQIKIDSVIIDASTKNEISLINEKLLKTLN